MWSTQDDEEEESGEGSSKFGFHNQNILLRNRNRAAAALTLTNAPEVNFNTVGPGLTPTKWRETSNSPPLLTQREQQTQVRKVNSSSSSSSRSSRKVTLSKNIKEAEFSSDNDSDDPGPGPSSSSSLGDAQFDDEKIIKSRSASASAQKEESAPASNHLIFWFGLTFLILSSLHLATNGGRRNTEISITVYSFLEKGCGGLESSFGALKTKFASLRKAAEEASRLSWQKAQDELTKFLKNLKTKFPSQKSTTWIQIYASISSTMTQKTPRSPACLVFLTPSSVPGDFATCLAQEVARVTQSVFDNIIFGFDGGSSVKKKENNFLKITKEHFNQFHSVDEMHEEINNYLLKSGRVIVVQDVHRFEREDHLFLFHAYCDNNEAPDKRATFIFTLPIPPGVSSKVAMAAEANAVALSEAILADAWAVLSSDKKPAVISRVVSSAVLLQPGDQCGN